ncbi:MAG: ROK family protein [Candidatus Riflebacteria bacterium HGW-Riflebacteria-2]|jgi:glucokinase|nr:MAG: ROK family protein [Candidatus Riflebacteria bacterium HGW-Riflebacteria-2]
MRYYCGIDLGGTKIYSILCDNSGKIVARKKIKTEAALGFDTVFANLVTCYGELLKKAEIVDDDVEKIGLAVPSAVNTATGMLLDACNLGWKNVPLARLLSERLKKPVFMDNDVNMGVFGEYSFGEASKFRNVYGIFAGTGVGGGHINNGSINRGKNFTAGEVGHMVVKIDGPECNCGRKGCLEAIAGKAGIIKYMKKQEEKNGFKTMLSEISPDWRTMVGSAALKECYKKKDALVVKAINRASEALGIAAANIINLIGVEALILGGGVIEEMGSLMMPAIVANAKKYAIAGGAEGVGIIVSKLGDDAVALGAAWYAAKA